MPRFSFDDAIQKLKETPRGKEAAMYGPLRDIIVQVLEYPAADVDIDITGEGGRPDVTVRAPSGLKDGKDRPLKIDWIVVEAKDEPGCFFGEDSREAIFAKKSKYVGPHTAWFVMVDPRVIVLRSVSGATLSAEADVVLQLDSISETAFRHHTLALHASKAGVSLQLERFRAGDMTMIAVEKLSTTIASPSKALANRIRTNRKRFFQQVREATAHLQQAVATALARQAPHVAEFKALADEFWEEFGKPGEGGDPFDQHTLSIHGRPEGPVQSKRHDREAAKLRRDFSRAPHVARLALRGLPDFQSRTGVEDEQLDELFAIETANLILARVLLLRFFEDHGFFGELHYVCNGGVEAFQKMRSYFKSSYSRLLEQAYQEGSRLYASAFDETELDWIFGVKDEVLSSAIEWTLFRFARYDFQTARGDLLTGIYDRFMDRAQRKKLGEFYTPPSIARFIVNKLDVGRESRVLDPACGSGTFLIESYRAMVGIDVERGAADYSDVIETFTRIAGNDLNTFSSVLAQIQLLWQVLALKADIETSGFPDLRVTAKVNSLVERDQWSALDRFAEIDQPEYDAVVGNPPYVRAERSAQALDKRSQDEFERPRHGHPGISSKLNAYALFLYRALDRWCRPVDADGRAGRVGFILPVSLFDSNDTAELRRLFGPAGRWTIREIIDLEVIYRKVFDADTLPAIFIAENRPPRDDDEVAISYADHSCVSHPDRDALAEFDLASLAVSKVAYGNLFSPDGRILTRLTPTRLAILQKLWAQETFRDAAKPYWVRKVKGKIVEALDVDPARSGFEQKRMIAGGIAYRATAKKQASPGHSVFKGENIVAAELQGDAVLLHADIEAASDRSLWAYKALLPKKGYAIASVAHTPNAVAFDARTTAFTNTAVLFFPKEKFSAVPFDLLLLSNVYVWFYALAARMGVLRQLRSHMYPTNLALLPWGEGLLARSHKIEAMRKRLIAACSAKMAASAALDAALEGLALASFKKHLQADADAHVLWGDNFDDPSYEVDIAEVSVAAVADGWKVQLSADMYDWVECNRESLARGLALGLQQFVGYSLTRGQVLNLAIPGTSEQVQRWGDVIAAHAEAVLLAEMTAALSALDAEVGAALGLDAEDVAEIQRDMESDAFLRGIRPRYPGTVTRKQGFRTGLDSGERYE
jgi:SAM-dependent methyltransferase